VRARLHARGESAVGLPVPESDEDLPEFYRLGSGLCLIRDSKKRDVYNATTPTSCSCPAGHKPGEPCGHSMIFFPAREVSAEEKAVA